jgi:hypothetical protein
MTEVKFEMNLKKIVIPVCFDIPVQAGIYLDR